MLHRFAAVLILIAVLAAELVTNASAANTRDVVVQFSTGTTSATLTDRLGSEHAVRYILGARKDQFLRVTLRPDNPLTYFIIYLPGGDILDESSQAGNEYYGQLFKNGDHVVEVFYKGEPGTKGQFAIDFAITSEPASGPTGGGSDGGGQASANYERPVGGVLPEGSSFTASSIIPCERDGTGSAQCDVGIVREGNGNGFLIVFWPDAGNRVLYFEDGAVVRYDESEADGGARLRVERDGDIQIVTIGDARFEIFDAMMFGG